MEHSAHFPIQVKPVQWISDPDFLFKTQPVAGG